MKSTSRTALLPAVFRLSTGDYNGALVTGSGRIVWQGGCHPTRDEALAEVESQRTAFFIRRFLRSELRSEAGV